MNPTDILGYAAAFLTTFAMLPQALHVYRTQQVEQLSARTFGMATVGAVLWIAYGLIIDNTVIFLANAVGLCLVGYIFTKKMCG